MKLTGRWAGLALCLGGWGLAGGSGPTAPITSGDALRSLPGVTVTEAPTGNFEIDSARWMTGVGYTYAVRVRVGAEQVRVLLSPVAIENSSTVNSLLAFVETTAPTATQRQALVRIARDFLETCAPGLAAQAQTIWPGLTRDNWADVLGWQDRQLGSVRVGWSGREGLSIGERDVTGINVAWPGSSGRCVFQVPPFPRK